MGRIYLYDFLLGQSIFFFQTFQNLLDHSNRCESWPVYTCPNISTHKLSRVLPRCSAAEVQHCKHVNANVNCNRAGDLPMQFPILPGQDWSGVPKSLCLYARFSMPSQLPNVLLLHFCLPFVLSILHTGRTPH